MMHPKMVLGGLLAIAVIIGTILILVPSNATAQALVEYQLICTEDIGVPQEAETKQDLAILFDIPSWPDNWGAFFTCTPKFAKDTNIFNKLRICAIAYEDTNSTGHLEFGDVKQMEVCTTIKE